jgi:hypothetical protein
LFWISFGGRETSSFILIVSSEQKDDPGRELTYLVFCFWEEFKEEKPALSPTFVSHNGTNNTKKTKTLGPLFLTNKALSRNKTPLHRYKTPPAFSLTSISSPHS